MIDKLEKGKINIDDEIQDAKKELKTVKFDMSLGELSNMYVEKELIISPEFQRFFRWDEHQQTRLIESILVGIPMPSIFVAENEDGSWELIDGLQRLSTVFSFMGKLNNSDYDRWKLRKGDILTKIEKFSFDDLSFRTRNIIKRYICRVEMIYYGNDHNIRYELFERLNTGGTPLSDQEIRNAIYRGTSTNFNDFLSRNGSDETFLKNINISSSQEKSLYADELVLRFCSLYDNEESITKNLKHHLNNYMKKMVEKTKEDTQQINELEIIFKRTINLLSKINKEKIFWRKKGGFSATLYDGIMIGVSKNINSCEKLNNEELYKKIIELRENDDFNKNSGSMSHNARNVKGRLRISNEVFKNI